jgi:hypothetical protein
LKAELLDDAFHAAGADGKSSLTKLLGNDVGRGIGVEEAVADDLPDHHLSTHRWALGPTFLAAERGRPVLVKELQELVIARPAQALLHGCGRATEALALSLDKHEESFGDLVIGRNKELAESTNDSSFSGNSKRMIGSPDAMLAQWSHCAWRIEGKHNASGSTIRLNSGGQLGFVGRLNREKAPLRTEKARPLVRQN